MSLTTLPGRLASTAAPTPTLQRRDACPVEWRVGTGLVAYETALALMEARVDAIRRGEARELVWLLEHPPLYTAGTSAGADQPRTRFPLYQSGRGGQVTYHGPGQRVAYVMLDLQARSTDLRAFVAALERWIIDTLAAFDIAGERREDRVGVWVRRPDKPVGLDGSEAEDKIAAIGIRVRRWVTFHGISLNVEPDLSHYAEITPCGITARQFGVTSFADLGHALELGAVDVVLRDTFAAVFGAVIPETVTPD